MSRRRRRMANRQPAPRAGPRWHRHGPSRRVGQEAADPAGAQGDVPIPEDLGAERVILQSPVTFDSGTTCSDYRTTPMPTAGRTPDPIEQHNRTRTHEDERDADPPQSQGERSGLGARNTKQQRSVSERRRRWATRSPHCGSSAEHDEPLLVLLTVRSAGSATPSAGRRERCSSRASG
jgi:hypothetical protein